MWKQGLIVIFILREMQEAIWIVTSSVKQSFELHKSQHFLSAFHKSPRRYLRTKVQELQQNTLLNLVATRTACFCCELKISHYNISISQSFVSTVKSFDSNIFRNTDMTYQHKHFNVCSKKTIVKLNSICFMQVLYYRRTIIG